MYNIPERGPPGLIPRYRTQGADEANRRTPSPVVTHRDSNIPSAPEASDDASMSQRKNWRPVSPSPESLSLPEQERPPSWQEELLSPQLAPIQPEVIVVDELSSIHVSSKSPTSRKRDRNETYDSSAQKIRLTPNTQNLRTPHDYLLSESSPAGERSTSSRQNENRGSCDVPYSSPKSSTPKQPPPPPEEFLHDRIRILFSP